MVKWLGQGMPGFMVVKRKPTPKGLELHTMCDAGTGIMIYFEVYEGKVAMSTKEYMAQHMSKFDEPYERAKKLNRAGDISQLAPGAKIALQTHAQKLDDRAIQFLKDSWKESMQPLGYQNYDAFAQVVRERNKRLFGKGS